MFLLATIRAVFLSSVVLPVVIGQTTHVVTVGIEGSFFSPQTISAELDDTVTFIFGGDVHTVTQSSFESPCVQLAGGFNSGFQGRGPNFSAPTPIWNLQITNVSEPIWLFCLVSTPTSHCESGMVGAINPPSIAMFNQFQAAAKAVTSTPKPSGAFVASGIGAAATGSPMLSSLPLSSIMPSMSSSSSASTTPTPTATSIPDSQSSSAAPSATTSSHTGVNKGLVAGLATAGALIVVIIVVIAFFCGRSGRITRYRFSHSGRRGDANEDMYQRPDHRGPVAGAYAGHGGGTTPILAQAFSTPVASPPSTAAAYDESEDLDRERYRERERRQDRDRDRKPGLAQAQWTPQDTAPPASPPYLSPRSDVVRPLPHRPSNGQLRSEQADPVAPSAPVDINALAMEVASVLMQTPPRSAAGSAADRHARRSPGRSPDNSSRWYSDQTANESEESPVTRAASAAPPYSGYHGGF